ncbi:MAG: Bug family tripartite tricarboxylate transporter substrate binding protein [Burkholderiaceae bacterium]
MTSVLRRPRPCRSPSLRRSFAGAALAAACLAPGLSVAQSADRSLQSYPERPVRIVVPYGAGGAADILARMMADKLGQIWGQSVVVENKPGGVGTIGIMSVVSAPADGYTLVSVPVSDLSVNPHLYRNRPFNVSTDLAPVSQVGAVPNVLVVSASSGITDANALIALARSKPGAVTYSSPGVGSQAHLAAEMFAEAIGVKLLHVPYNGVAQALADVAKGQVDLMFAQLPAVLPMVRGGRLLNLGVAAEARTELAPEVPTLKEVTGKSLGDAVSWSGLMAPAKTPLALRQKIAADVTRAMQSPDMRQRLAQQGVVGLGGTPQALAAAIAADSERYGKVIRALNLSLD